MADENKKNTDDFFKLLDPNQSATNTADEIVFRDENGVLKVLRNGAVVDFENPTASLKPVAPVEPQDVPVAPVPVEQPKMAETVESSALEQAVVKAVQKSGLTFADEQLTKRFQNLALSRLKGVRNRVQVREILLEPSNQNGLGLDEATADKVGTILTEISDELHNHHRTSVSNEQFSDLQSEAQKLLVETPIEKPLRSFAPTPVAEPEVKTEPAPLPVTPIAEPPLFKTPSAPVRPIQKVEPPVTAPLPPPSVRPQAGKPKIEDVRFQAKLTGPVEEIRTMTVTDFRRLAQTPALATAKILEKIELLEDESFTRRVEGIRAWKENEINRLYVELGHQSMEERKPIATIIAERQQTGRETLTEAEIEAVIELNKRLRY